MKAKTVYSIARKSGYGQYNLIKETPSGKITKVHCTDSQLFDDYTEGKASQRRLKMLFDFYYKKI